MNRLGTQADEDLRTAPPEAVSDEGALSSKDVNQHLPLGTWFVGSLFYLPLAALGFWPVWSHWSSNLNGCNCWDQILLEWFVHWTPSAVAHGHSLLVTNYIDAPGGINVMWNTSVLALGAIASPLTETIGVVHTMAILLALSLALSASTMFLLLRRWVQWWPAAWLGGLVYGFSAFAIQEATSGRLTFVFDAIPPLIILVLVKLISKEWPPIRSGVVMGALVAFQLVTSEELLAIVGTLIGVSLIVLSVLHREEVLERGRDIIEASTAAAATFLVLMAYPLYVQFAGADRLTGPPQTKAQIAKFSTDLLAPVVPGSPQWLDPSWTNHISSAFTASSAAELTEYVGIPLLLFVLATAAVLRKRTAVRIIFLTGLAAFALSLGPRVLVDNRNTGIPGPYAVLTHVPILSDIIPSRIAIAFWFSIAILFAIGIDEAHRWGAGFARQRLETWAQSDNRAQRAKRNRATARFAAAAAAVLAVCILVPLVPNWPYAEQPADVPAFFTSSDVDVVPPGSLVTTYPYPLTAMAWPMLWQADTGMRYRILGGYVIGPAPDGTGTFFPDPNPIQYCLLFIYVSGTSNYCNPEQIRSTLRKLGVTVIIADDTEPHVGLARSIIAETLGAKPRHVGGVSIWRCVPRNLTPRCSWT